MTFTGGSRVTAAELNSNTMELITSSSLLAPSGSVVLPISGTYNHLKVFWRARGDAAVSAEQMYLQFNGDSGSNYLVERVETNNTTTTPIGPGGAATTRIQIATITAGSATGLYFASGEFLVSGASDTTNFKTVVGPATAYGSVSNAYVGTYGGQWNSAAAVGSLTLTPNSGNFVAGCLFSVYGLS